MRRPRRSRGVDPAVVTAVAGGVAGVGDTDIITEVEVFYGTSGADLLIVLDVVKAGHAPGTLVRIAGEAVPKFFRRKLSPHQIGLPDVLASLELLGTMPADIVVHGVEPASLELGLAMTDSVAGAVPLLAQRAAADLQAHGFAVREK